MTEPHPDDESLSAALDGEDPAAAAHVVACTACRARSEALRATATAVGTSSRLPTGVADRAIAAAVAAFATERSDLGAGHEVGRGEAEGQDEDDNVVPLRTAGPLPDSFSSHRAGGGGGKRVPGWVMGVAAALLAVLVAVPVLNSGGDDDDSADVASAGRDTSKAATISGGPLIEGGDLGDQTDQLALGELLSGALTGTPQSAPAATADESTAAAPAPASEAADATRAADPENGGPALSAPNSVAPAASPSAASDPAVAACEASVAEEYTETLGLGPLVYRATLRWQGTPAVLLAYRLADTSSEGADHQAFVMALDGCRLLVVQGF